MLGSSCTCAGMCGTFGSGRTVGALHDEAALQLRGNLGRDRIGGGCRYEDIAGQAVQLLQRYALACSAWLPRSVIVGDGNTRVQS